MKRKLLTAGAVVLAFGLGGWVMGTSSAPSPPEVRTVTVEKIVTDTAAVESLRAELAKVKAERDSALDWVSDLNGQLQKAKQTSAAGQAIDTRKRTYTTSAPRKKSRRAILPWRR